MNGYAIATLLIAGSGMALSRRLHGSLFSPLAIYAAAWGTLVTLYVMRGLVGRSFINLTPTAWFLVATSTAAFVLGSVLGVGLISRRYDLSMNTDHGLDFVPKRLPPLLVAFTVVGALGVLAKWVILINTFGSLTRAVTSIGELRGLSLQGSFSYPVFIRLSILLLFPVLLFAAVNAPRSRRHRFLTVWIIVLFFLGDFTIGARGHTVFGFTLAIVAYAMAAIHAEDIEPRVLTGKLGAVAVVGILFANLILFVRAGVLGSLSVAAYLLQSARTIYFYATGPLPAFSWAVEQGSMTAYPAAYSIGGLYRIANYAGEILLGHGFVPRPPKPWALTPIGFNTYPHLWAIYSDFGALGMYVILFSVGASTAYVYSRYRADPSATTLVVTILAVTFAAWSPRDLVTFWVSFWILAFVGITLAFVADRTRTAPSNT